MGYRFPIRYISQNRRDVQPRKWGTWRPVCETEEFLEDGLARKNLLRDGQIMKYDNRV